MKDDKRRTEKDEGKEGQEESTQSTATVTITRKNAEAKTSSRPASLTLEEEKVIRMLYGKSLQGQEALEFAPGASMETKLKLALIEANLLKAFEAGALEPDPDTGSPRSVLAELLS